MNLIPVKSGRKRGQCDTEKSKMRTIYKAWTTSKIEPGTGEDKKNVNFSANP